jgi:predicted permease
MSPLLLIVLCLAAGVLLRRFARVADNAHQALNAVIVHVSLPAATLHHLHGFDFVHGQIGAVLMPWLLFAIGAGVFWSAGRWLRLPRTTVGALMLVGGLGNTSFVGLPMIESLHGRDGLGLGLLIDQLGSYLALSTVGALVALWYGSGPQARPTIGGLLRKVVAFPPLIAMVLALLLQPLPMPPSLDQALARIGDTLVPLALLSVGMQLRLASLPEHARALWLGLSYKLLACPALVLALLWWLDAPPDTLARVSVIEAAMPPMIGAGIVAAQAGLNAPLVSLMIGLGIPIGLATATAWHGLALVLVA